MSLKDLGLNVKLIGNYHEIYFWTTERIFRGYGIEKLSIHPHEATEVDCDVAIINYPFDCKVRLPKAKVQLCLHTEQPYQYDVGRHGWFMDYADGGLCGTGALGWWRNATTKPHFGFDLLCRWDGFYQFPSDRYAEMGVIVGGASPHRQAVVNASRGRIGYLWGYPDQIKAQLPKYGIGYNVHSDAPTPKTESGRLGLYLNMGMAVISEPLDDCCPPHWQQAIPQHADILQGIHFPNQAKWLAGSQAMLMNSLPSSNTMLDEMFTSIKSTFNL